MKIGIIGGGIFGCTAAIHLARVGHETHLFERADQLMQAATAVNQFRLHRGYHYPRSPETGAECRQGMASFEREYGEAIIHGGQQYYAIAKGSRTSADDFIRFMDRQGLAWSLADSNAPLFGDIEAAFCVSESRVDYHKLRSIVERELERSGVRLHIGYCKNLPDRSKELPSRDDYDRIIVAAYANTNKVVKALGCRTTPFQFEVCEKPVVKLPDRYRDTGVVVMDGPFCSIDPYGFSGQHVLGHVKHAIHWTKTGDAAFEEIRVGRVRGGAALAPSIEMNAGILPEPAISNYDRFIEDGSRFCPFLKQAEYIGSMFTVRAVLPDKDATDERPTLVEHLDDQVIRIFSGKIGTAVEAARKTLSMVERERVAA